MALTESEKKEYEQLSDIAPTVLLNYAEPSWQELTETIADITGHEADAEQVIADYDSFVSDQAALISLPEQPVTVLSYMGADGGWVLDAESQQALLLDSIGFDYVGVDPQRADGYFGYKSALRGTLRPDFQGSARSAQHCAAHLYRLL